MTLFPQGRILRIGFSCESPSFLGAPVPVPMRVLLESCEDPGGPGGHSPASDEGQKDGLDGVLIRRLGPARRSGGRPVFLRELGEGQPAAAKVRFFFLVFFLSFFKTCVFRMDVTPCDKRGVCSGDVLLG